MKQPTPALKAPTPAAVRRHLARLTLSQLKWLARRSGVPYMTLYGIRCGKTKDPQLSTVSALEPHYAQAKEIAP